MLSILEFIDESGLSETTRFEGLHGQEDGEILVFFKDHWAVGLLNFAGHSGGSWGLNIKYLQILKLITEHSSPTSPFSDIKSCCCPY